jgi:hypothetical protein
MAAEIRGRIDKDELQQVASAARAANALIDQRTFSWTAFFNHLETTMPPDVMLKSVRPRPTAWAGCDAGASRVRAGSASWTNARF